MTTTLATPIIPEDVQLGMKLGDIFMPYARKQRDSFYKRGGRFVHYTTAEAAVSIIKTKRIWMRNTTCMSDYREVQHGYEMLRPFFSDRANGGSFAEALDACCTGVAQEAINHFDEWWHNIRFNTYIASISEHDDKEDLHGRLSMWRAFGGNAARVAFVFKVPWYSAGTAALRVAFSPVAYPTNHEIREAVENVVNNIRTYSDFLRSVDRSALIMTVFQMLMMGVTCLKHEGFHEEREWRVIYFPLQAHSPLIEESTETIGGVPQLLYKLPLDGAVSPELDDLDMSRMFDRLIIGPSAYPWAMYQAFVPLLAKAGIAQPEQRVFVSNIPIRA
jgi:hypothetical protein